MLVGLPHVSKQKCADFRACFNGLLEQHPHVGVPFVPRWVWAREAAAGSHALAQAGAFVNLGNDTIVRGPHFIVVRPSGEAALVTPAGGCFFVGAVACEPAPFHGAVLVVALTRRAGDAFYGGALHLLDVLAYDGVCLLEKSPEFRRAMLQLLPPAMRFPTRYRIGVASWNSAPVAPEACALAYLLPPE